MRSSIFSRRAWISGLCLALAALSGCGGGGGDSGGGTGDGANFAVTLEMRGANGAPSSSFEFGNNIVFALTITNRSGGSQVLNLPTSQIYDLAVFPEGAQTPRWRWSFNRTATQVPTSLTFTSHQSITYLFLWDGVLEDGTQIMPGTYQFRGMLAYEQYADDWLTNDELAAAPKRITITD
jgi:hypothetical protein